MTPLEMKLYKGKYNVWAEIEFQTTTMPPSKKVVNTAIVLREIK